VRVTIKLFARLRDIVGCAELVRELDADATVRTAWGALAAEWPELASYERSISTAVNADYARMTHPLAEGDEVAFLPPVSGGCFSE